MSAAGTFQGLVLLASSLFVLKILSGFGPDAVAGYVVAARLLMFVGLPFNGLSTAAFVLAGQNLPAGRRRYTVHVVHTACFAVVVAAVFLGGALAMTAGPLASLFDLDSGARHHAIGFIVVSAAFLPAAAISAVMVHVANGIGRLRIIALLQLFSLAGVQIPVTLLLIFGSGWTRIGVWLGIGLGQLALTVLASSVVRRYVSPRVLAFGSVRRALRV